MQSEWEKLIQCKDNIQGTCSEFRFLHIHDSNAHVEELLVEVCFHIEMMLIGDALVYRYAEKGVEEAAIVVAEGNIEAILHLTDIDTTPTTPT